MQYRLAIVVQVAGGWVIESHKQSIKQIKEQSICVQTERVTKVSSDDQVNMPRSLKSRLVENDSTNVCRDLSPQTGKSTSGSDCP